MTIPSKPISPIAITMGCPASIGPEIILSLYHAQRQQDISPVAVIGDIGVLKKSAQILGLKIKFNNWKPGMELDHSRLNVYCQSEISPNNFSFGIPTLETGKAMVAYVETAIKLCMEDRLSAMVTCPISKFSLHQAGLDFPGHTELLADRTNTRTVAMMLAGPTLRVVPATIHCALSEVPGKLKSDLLVELIKLIDHSLISDFGIASPHIAVAGLNPHAGENGLFGNEEQTIIEPAIAEAKMMCSPTTQISGPYPPDTLFNQALSKMFDVVLTMYHDQGLIPFKLLHFDDGVNVTLGLPIIRTSVDHGTAYDIAGQGTAGYASLIAAVDMAEKMAANRAAQRT